MASNSPAATPRQDAAGNIPLDLFSGTLWHPSPSIVPDDPPPTYPQVAGFKGEPGGPSEAAAKVINLSITGRRAEVLDLLRSRAERALTADEIAVRLNRSILSVRPRVAELHKLGLIEPATQRGRNESGMSAHCWQAVRS
jgi:hypothetical protein